MIRLTSREPLPPALRGAVVALGNFDGFHAGHQAVVGAAVARARAENRPAIVATFDPHPMRLFVPDAPPFRLTTLAQRAELFAAAGADAMLVLAFDAAMAAIPAEAWVSEFLAQELGAKAVITGADFTFGKARGGDTQLLARAGAAHGITAHAIPAVMADGEAVSSSRIRAALAAGDCATATRMLTRPFAVRGQVRHGAKLGRSIGYPTANLDMDRYLRPAYGIYAVSGRIPGADGDFARARVVLGAANLGIRPSFDPPVELLEPTFFDFAEDLYGREIEVALHAFIRPEAKFDGLEALTRQIDADCDEARRVLAALGIAPHLSQGRALL